MSEKSEMTNIYVLDECPIFAEQRQLVYISRSCEDKSGDVTPPAWPLISSNIIRWRLKMYETNSKLYMLSKRS